LPFECKGEFHDFYLRLPYLSIWIKSNLLEEPIEYLNGIPIDEAKLMNIYEQDKYARICFFGNGFSGCFTLLFNITQIDLVFTKDRSLIDISLGDILNHGTILLTDRRSSRSLTLIQSYFKPSYWSGKRINSIKKLALSKKKNAFIYLPEGVH
jgi:hypothetical protein